jgi:hypothetical protein
MTRELRVPIYRRFSLRRKLSDFAMEDLPAIRSFGPWMRSEIVALAAKLSRASTRAATIL